jgi:hypothetical protein
VVIQHAQNAAESVEFLDDAFLAYQQQQYPKPFELLGNTGACDFYGTPSGNLF